MSTASVSPRVQPELYLTLAQALRLLPDVRPRLAREQLGRAVLKARRNSAQSVRIAAVTVTRKELEELFIEDARNLPHVSPAGASVLLRLHAAGALETSDTPHTASISEELQRYVESLPTLLRRQAELDAAQEAVNAMVLHPEQATSQQLTFDLLNRIFQRHCGRGPATLKVGEVDVTKHCSLLRNSKRETRIRFTWTDAQGVDHELGRLPVSADSERSAIEAKAVPIVASRVPSQNFSGRIEAKSASATN